MGGAQMSVYVVIPARFGSTRFPGKPLTLIKGVALLERVVRQVQKIKASAQILVATDDERIQDLCKKIQVPSVMTDSTLQSGTDRIYQALLRSGLSIQNSDVVINVQGDEPLIPPQWIEKLLQVFAQNSQATMATLAHPLTQEELENPNSVKVVTNQNGQALYFSRFPIPHSREKSAQPVSLKHVGIYAYRFSTLKAFCEAKPSPLEMSESLEQLRAMDLGYSIQVIQVEGAIQGVDVPEDVKKVESLL